MTSPNVILKPKIPTRPDTLKGSVCSESIKHSQISQVGEKSYENFAINESQILSNAIKRNEVVSRKPKPAPRPRKIPDSKPIPPTPQPRQSYLSSSDSDPEKFYQKTNTCLEVRTDDNMALYNKSEIGSENISNDKLKDSLVSNNTKFICNDKTNKENDKPINPTSHIDYNVDTEDFSRCDDKDKHTANFNRKAKDAIDAENENMFYCETNQSPVNSLKSNIDIDGTKDNCGERTLNLKGKSLGPYTQVCLNKSKSVSENDLVKYKQISNDDMLLKSSAKDEIDNEKIYITYENVKFRTKSDNYQDDEYKQDLLPCSITAPTIKQKQSSVETGHPYENVLMHNNNSQGTSFSESLIDDTVLERLNKHSSFFVPKVLRKSSKERKHFKSCDNIFINQDSSNTEEHIYDAPPTNRDSGLEIYAIPPNNQSVDTYTPSVHSPNSNSLLSSPSNRSSGTSQESARFSTTSNSSCNSSISEKSLSYQNVDLANPTGKSFSNPDIIEVTSTEVDDVSSSPGKKQRKTNSRKLVNNSQTYNNVATGYANVTPEEKLNNYMQLDFTSEKKIGEKITIKSKLFNIFFLFMFAFLFFIPSFLSQVHKHPREDNSDLFYWAEITGQHTQTFITYQIPKPLTFTVHMINSSSCGNNSTILVPHPNTI